MKHKLATLDVAAEVSCLRHRIIGTRVVNVYDISAKTYIIKLARTGEDGEKIFVLLESGVRFHSTAFTRDKADLPSATSMKLRKHLRGKRVSEVAQLGVDRIVDFAFGSGDAAHHVILEMYAGGNLILTDSAYQVLLALRVYKDAERGVAVMPGLPYPVTLIRLFEPVRRDALAAALAEASEKLSLKHVLAQLLLHGPGPAEHCLLRAGLDPARRPAQQPLSDGEVAAVHAEAQRLAQWRTDWDHAPPRGYILLRAAPAGSRGTRAASATGAAAVAPGRQLPAAAEPSSGAVQRSGPAEQYSGTAPAGRHPGRAGSAAHGGWAQAGVGAQQPSGGAGAEDAEGRGTHVGEPLQLRAEGGVPDGVVAGDAGGVGEVAPQARRPECPEGMVYDDFDPLLLQQKVARPHLDFDTFDAALDEFYSKSEQQRALQQRAQQVAAAYSKVDKVRADLDKRSTGLARAAAAAERAARAIEANLGAVDAAIAAVNAQLAAGTAWAELVRLVEEQRARGAPVAQMIASLRLEEARATLLLDDPDATESSSSGSDGEAGASGDEAPPTVGAEQSAEVAFGRRGRRRARRLRVVVDLNANAYTNARQYFAEKKAALEKRDRTLAANGKALRHAECATATRLAAADAARVIRERRRSHWFERFIWFVSSEGYLVLAGRDAQQADLLVTRYMRACDVYVHTDTPGAAAALVVNLTPDREVSPIAINQAGAAVVCRSRAWDAKAAVSAWWVSARHVSKLAPTGDPMPAGEACILARKNFLPPAQVVMGFGVLFAGDAASAARHAAERTVMNAHALARLPEGSGSGGAQADAVAAGAPVQAAGGEGESWLREEAEGGGAGRDTSAPDLVRTSGAEIVRGESLRADVAAEGSRDSSESGGESAAPLAPEGHVEGQAGELAEGSETFGSGAGGERRKGAGEEEDLTQRYGRYGLSAVAAGDQEEEEARATREAEHVVIENGALEESRWKRPLSKAERAALKKGLDPTEVAAQRAAATGTTHAPVAQTKQSASGTGASHSSEAGAGAGAAAKRGQKGKQKRRAAKYGDQDDEDAAIVATLLAAQGPSRSKGERRAERKARKAEKKAGSKQASSYNEGIDADVVSDAIAKAKQGASALPAGQGARKHGPAERVPAARSADAGPPGRAVPGRPSNTIDGGSARGHGGSDCAVQHEAQVVEQAGAVTDGQTVDGKGMDEGECASVLEAALAEIRAFTGQPTAEDALLYGIPICAPYDVLQKYKFKVKLTPGGQKKGKAARHALELLTHLPTCSPREKELLQAITDSESVAAMIGNVKVTMPGMQRVQQSRRKGGKGGK